MGAEARIAELKLELPPPPKPIATYLPCVQVKELVYVSGHGPLKPDKTLIIGRVGADYEVHVAGVVKAHRVMVREHKDTIPTIGRPG